MASSQGLSQAFRILAFDSLCAEWVDAGMTAEQGATCAGIFIV